MSDFLDWFVPIYFAVYVVAAFGWRSYLVWRRTHINPIVLSTSDDAYGFVSSAFKVCMVGVGLLVLGHLLKGAYWMVPIPFLQRDALQVIGVLLMVAALIWITIAQAQMGLSWRIGIDQKNKTLLVRDGLYRISRNPIFLGMNISLLGLFLVYPTAASLVLLTSAYILISVQIRLEEEHLHRLHGAIYDSFKHDVRRWL